MFSHAVPPPAAAADAGKEVGLFKEGGSLISFLYPAQNQGLVEALAKKHLTVLGEWVGAP